MSTIVNQVDLFRAAEVHSCGRGDSEVPMGLQPKIVRRSLEAQAADVLRDRIVSGRIPNGARLTETALATDLGLSRGPVRAALQQLSNEQLVVQRPYAGWEVRRLRRKDIWEISTLRSALEGLAARLATHPQRVGEAGFHQEAS